MLLTMMIKISLNVILILRIENVIKFAKGGHIYANEINQYF